MLVFLKFCKILVNARFCGVCTRQFFMLLHRNCLFKLHFLWHLNSQFLHVQVKTVKISAKRDTREKKIVNGIDYFTGRHTLKIIQTLTKKVLYNSLASMGKSRQYFCTKGQTDQLIPAMSLYVKEQNFQVLNLSTP